MRLVIRPAAAADVEAAYGWYLEQEPEVADWFISAFEDAIQAALAHPEAYQVVHRGTRRVLLRRFPYALYFRLQGDAVVVVACMHLRRRPLRWKSRS